VRDDPEAKGSVHAPVALGPLALAGAPKVEAWLNKAMVDGMDAVVNAAEPHVRIEVETSVSQTWGD